MLIKNSVVPCLGKIEVRIFPKVRFSGDFLEEIDICYLLIIKESLVFFMSSFISIKFEQ